MGLNLGFTIFIAVSLIAVFLVASKHFIKDKTKDILLIFLLVVTVIALVISFKNLYLVIVTIVTLDESTPESKTPSFFETMVTNVLPLLIDIALLILEFFTFYKDQFSVKDCNINFEDLEIVDKGISSSNNSKKCIRIILTEKNTKIPETYYIKPQTICFQLCLYPDIFDFSWEEYRNINENEQGSCVLRDILTEESKVFDFETIVGNNQLVFSFSFESEISIVQDLIQNNNNSNDKKLAIVLMSYNILKRNRLLSKISDSKYLKKYLVRNSKKVSCKFTRNAQVNSKKFSAMY